MDLWLKDLAPSTELRKMVRPRPGKWDEFRKRYKAELEKMVDLLVLLKHRATAGAVTLVYVAHDEGRNSAVALKEYLEGL